LRCPSLYFHGGFPGQPGVLHAKVLTGAAVRIAMPHVSPCAVAACRYSRAHGPIHTFARKRRGPSAALLTRFANRIRPISSPRNCHRRVTFGSADPISRLDKNIKSGDEITYHYGRDYFDSFIKTVVSKTCNIRAVVARNRWMRSGWRPRIPHNCAILRYPSPGAIPPRRRSATNRTTIRLRQFPGKQSYKGRAGCAQLIVKGGGAAMLRSLHARPLR
jgi:hypothetical protein